MGQKFKLGESVLYLNGDIKKVKVVSYKEELLDDGSTDVTYRIKAENGNMYSVDEYELGRNEIELANNFLDSYGFSDHLRFRSLCEMCARYTKEEDKSY